MNDRITVRYRETGAIRSIPREAYDPAIHEIVVTANERVVAV